MKIRAILFTIGCSLIFTSCTQPNQTTEKAAPPPAKEASPTPPDPPADESHRFPTKDQVNFQLVNDHMLGKQQLPGGNLATYKSKGKTYELFLIKAKSSEAAAIWLLDLKSSLTKPAFVASFGGYYGLDNETPLFIFQKGAYLAGVSGLKQADADKVARELAARIN